MWEHNVFTQSRKAKSLCKDFHLWETAETLWNMFESCCFSYFYQCSAFQLLWKGIKTVWVSKRQQRRWAAFAWKNVTGERGKGRKNGTSTEVRVTLAGENNRQWWPRRRKGNRQWKRETLERLTRLNCAEAEGPCTEISRQLCNHLLMQQKT